MREQELISTRESPAVLGAAGLLFTALSAAAIIAVAAWAVLTALGLPGEGATSTAPVTEAAPHQPRSLIAVYVVWSEEEAAKVRAGFEDWDQALRDSGMQPDDIKRFVVAQSMDDLVRGRYFDFSQVDPNDGPGSEFRYVDLRR
jgi:hypothetical protein